MEKIKQKFGFGTAILGVMLVAVGVLFVIFTDSVKVLTTVLAIMLLVFGVGYGSFSLAKPEKAVGFVLKITVAVAAIACGTVTLVLVDKAAHVVANVFCLLLIVDGSFKLHTAVQAIKYKVFGWWFMTVLSVFVIVVSFIMSKQGFKIADNEVDNLPVLLGITIAVDGVANLFSSIYDHVCRVRAAREILRTVEEENAEENAEEIPAEEQTEAIEEKPTEEQTEAVEEKPTEEQTEATEEKPTEEQTEATEEKPAEEQTEAIEEKPAEEQTEAVEEKPAEEQTEATEEKPAEEQTEAAEEKPAEEQTEATEEKPAEEQTEATEEKPAKA